MPSGYLAPMKRRDLAGGLLAIFLVHLCYWPTRRAGLVTDFTGLQDRIADAPFLDFLHNFGFPALEQITHGFHWLFYHTFGPSPLAYYFLHTSLHLLNGYLLYRLLSALTRLVGWRDASAYTYGATLLFLLSPYQSEVVVWKVCFNYLGSTALMLGCLLAGFIYLAGGKNWAVGACLTCLTLAYFTFELALALPLLLLGLAFWVKAEKRMPWATVGTVAGLGLLSWIVYFSLNRFLLGDWIGHYGAEVHLQTDPKNILVNYEHYVVKFSAFGREWSGATKAAFRQWLKASPHWQLLAGIAFVGWGAALYFYQRLNPQLRLATLAFGLFGGAALPVINLYAAYILHVENDRYGYWPYAFFAVFLVALLGALPRKWGLGILALYLVASVFFLYRTNTYWQRGAAVYDRLVATYPPTTDSVTYVLAMPDNYRGTPLFKDFTKRHRILKSALYHRRGLDTTATVWQVASFNMERPTDRVSVSSDSLDHFRVQFEQWGNWWWRNGIGAATVTTPHWRWVKDHHIYHLTLYDPPAAARYLYTQGDRWRWAPSGPGGG